MDLDAESDTDLNGIIGYLVTVAIWRHDGTMQLDTGAAVSIIPAATYKNHLPWQKEELLWR